MIRRPLWMGAGMAMGVAGTLWAGQRVRRRLRRAAARLAPPIARGEALRAARRARTRVRSAIEVAGAETRRRESELWRALGEAPPALRERRVPRL